MTQARFYARPVHDRESGRWTVDTNIDGLFVEAASEKECQEVIAEFAADLIRENSVISDTKKSCAARLGKDRMRNGGVQRVDNH